MWYFNLYNPIKPLDSDWDNVPDAVESMLGNNTTFLQFYKFTRVHTELWDSYAWCIAYYFSLKLNESWDEIYSNIKDDPTYYIPHYNGENAYNQSCGENATKWLTSQFNAMVKENMPPMVVKFRLRVSNGKLHWHILVRDVGKIRNVLINDLTGSEFYVNSDINSVVFEKEGSFNLSTGEQLFRVKIELVSYDMVGNKLDMVKVVNGVVGEIVDAISQYVSLLFHVFGEVAKAVMSALNVIWNWVVSHIMDLLHGAMTPVLNALGSFSSGILSMITAYLNETRNSNSITVKDIFNAITSGRFFYVVLALCLAIQTISTFLTLYTMGLGALLGKAVSMVVVELAKELFKSMIVTTISLAGLNVIVAVLYFYKPKEDPFWKEGIGLAVFNFAVEFAKAVKGYMLGDKSGVITEALGLTIAMGGIFAAYYSTTFEWALISLVLSGIGAAVTWLNKDIFDRMIVAPLKNIEEIISVMALVYSISTLATFE